MKYLKKLLSIFLILWILTGISMPGNGFSTLSDTDQPPKNNEIIIED